MNLAWRVNCPYDEVEIGFDILQIVVRVIYHTNEPGYHHKHYDKAEFHLTSPVLSAAGPGLV